MKFSVSGTTCELQGIVSNDFSVCSVEKMKDLLAKSDRLAAVYLCSIQTTGASTEESRFLEPNEGTPGLTEAIRQLLLDFSDVFSIPDSLPPRMSCDHQIILN